MRRLKVKGIRWDKCIFIDLSRNMIDVAKLFSKINQTNDQDVLHLPLLYPYR